MSWFVFICLYLYSCLIFSFCSIIEGQELNCSVLKNAYDPKDIPNESIPKQAIPGYQLKICTQELTCCTNDMEHKLATLGRIKFDQKLRKILTKLKDFFIEQAHTIDGLDSEEAQHNRVKVLNNKIYELLYTVFFRELLASSKRDFHEMFLRTYGMIYDTNSYIFQDMFKDLEDYYNTGKVNLNEAMAYFFQRLYKKMFEVLNSQYQFSSTYLDCIGKYMDEMKPFGEIPQKLTDEIKKSFVAIRAFVQGLKAGHDVAKYMLQIELVSECSKALVKMTYCSHCQGLPHIKACTNYCLSVMRGCLAYHVEIDNNWREYTNSLLMLASQLENSFNIESSVLKFLISDAIMDFQENGAVISRTLFEHCGKPRLRKRSVDYLNLKLVKFSYQENTTTQGSEKSLDHLVQVIKKRIKQTKMFWIELPHKMCRSYRAFNNTHHDRNCWNGFDKSSNLRENTELTEKHNSRIYVDVMQQNSVVNQQILTLKLISTKMTDAVNGLDTKWEDGEFRLLAGGSGSKNSISNDDDDDEDNTLDVSGDMYFNYQNPANPATPKISTHFTSNTQKLHQAQPLLLCALLLYCLIISFTID